jgi:hypothetical protein
LGDFINATSGAAAWNYGAWVELVAAGVLTNHALEFLAVQTAAEEVQVQVGTGGAGSEVGRGEWHFVGMSAVSCFLEILPLLSIPAKARVAVRVAGSTGGLVTQVAAVFGNLPF